MSSITHDDIHQIAQIARLEKYTGEYSELGGGEINDTFLLKCDTENVILRVARYSDQTSLKTEAETLRLLDLQEVPKLLFFDETQRIKDKLWIVESYLEGRHIARLTLPLFESLGATLARVHNSTIKKAEVDVWSNFLKRRKQYGDEAALLNHPDKRLRELVRRARDYVKAFQDKQHSLPCSIIHGDATPTNILANDDTVSLIDWEFSHYNDPMAEFATIYYDDMDYNDGKWRIHISPEEREALFTGYRAGGGLIDEDRIQLWMNVDKLGASLYLYWRLHGSGRETNAEQIEMYNHELEKLIGSLQKQPFN